MNPLPKIVGHPGAPGGGAARTAAPGGSGGGCFMPAGTVIGAQSGPAGRSFLAEPAVASRVDHLVNRHVSCFSTHGELEPFRKQRLQHLPDHARSRIAVGRRGDVEPLRVHPVRSASQLERLQLVREPDQLGKRHVRDVEAAVARHPDADLIRAGARVRLHRRDLERGPILGRLHVRPEGRSAGDSDRHRSGDGQRARTRDERLLPRGQHADRSTAHDLLDPLLEIRAGDAGDAHRRRLERMLACLEDALRVPLRLAARGDRPLRRRRARARRRAARPSTTPAGGTRRAPARPCAAAAQIVAAPHVAEFVREDRFDPVHRRAVR